MEPKKVLRISDYESDEPDEMSVKCARCGKLIYRHATQCEFCGVHFSGQAYEFTHPSEAASHRVSPLVKWGMIIVVALLIIAILIGAAL